MKVPVRSSNETQAGSSICIGHFYMTSVLHWPIMTIKISQSQIIAKKGDLRKKKAKNNSERHDNLLLYLNILLVNCFNVTYNYNNAQARDRIQFEAN
jgi:hypothetical protein